MSNLDDGFRLNADQRLALKWIKEGRNVVITGQAGTGKSMVLGRVIEWLKEVYGAPIGVSNNRDEYAITSMTGISSVGIGGQTLHSWGGIGLGEGSVDKLMHIVRKRMKDVNWTTVKVLVIDEVSMMSLKLFEKLHMLACRLRRSRMLWGGIQLVLCGDFLQLPPIGEGEAGMFCFESEIWRRHIHRENVIHLTKIYRQGDVLFQRMLSRIRMGEVTPEDRRLLKGRIVDRVPKMQIKPTKLYPFKRNVEEINSMEFDKLIASGETRRDYMPIYEISIIYKSMEFSRLNATHHNELISMQHEIQRCSGKEICGLLGNRPENTMVKICTQAQVMLTYNVNVEGGLANGVRGIVLRFDSDGNPVCQFDGIQDETVVTRVIYTTESNLYDLKILQYPLALAWATTIHKSQGQTLTKVVTDLNCVFSAGQTYVCLSRVKSLEGLWLRGIDFRKIQCSKKARKYYYDLGYYCEFNYGDGCKDLMSTASWLCHPGICDVCLVWYLTQWVNDMPVELNEKIVNYMEM